MDQSAVQADAAPPQRKMFYTALYHAMLGPTLFMDVDGRYRGPDNAVHQADDFRFHSTFSLWDTFRAEHPLLSLLRLSGRAVPEDTSVVAICPDQVALQASPRLTSVSIPAEEMGRRAVRLAMAQLDSTGGAQEPITLIPPALTARESSAAGPAAGL